jgi:hypothetical protein
MPGKAAQRTCPMKALLSTEPLFDQPYDFLWEICI